MVFQQVSHQVHRLLIVSIEKTLALLRAGCLVKFLCRVGNPGKWEGARALLEFLWSRVKEDNLRDAGRGELVLALEDGTQMQVANI